MLQVTNALLGKRDLQILLGYTAFNERDDATLRGLFCDDVVVDGKAFPAWHPMEGGAPITGREVIISYLLDLWDKGIRADFRGLANHESASIAIDFTTDPRPEVGGDHACADKIEFDGSGRIKEVWHCSSGTHGRGTHAGHESHTHP